MAMLLLPVPRQAPSTTNTSTPPTPTRQLLPQLLSLQRNPLLGMLSFINFWFTAFLFAGFFVREADVIWPFKAFVYILPLRWSIAAIVRSEFEGSVFDGAVLADTPDGFECIGETPVCYGRTGTQVVKTLAKTFDLFDTADTFEQQLGY
mmetsp:Transcript_27973/g.65202  ORF Transcript_27973/g.65202 Transcript_27973/m.65202 type:complete len:149 (-) Transcript_27973:630-1076(-)